MLFTYSAVGTDELAPILATSPDDFCRISSCDHLKLDYSTLVVSPDDLHKFRRRPSRASDASRNESSTKSNPALAYKPDHLILPVFLCPNEMIRNILPTETDEMEVEARICETARYRLFDRSKKVLFPFRSFMTRKFSLILLNIYRSDG